MVNLTLTTMKKIALLISIISCSFIFGSPVQKSCEIKKTGTIKITNISPENVRIVLDYNTFGVLLPPGQDCIIEDVKEGEHNIEGDIGKDKYWDFTFQVEKCDTYKVTLYL